MYGEAEQRECGKLIEAAKAKYLAILDAEMPTAYDGLREWMRNHGYPISILRGTKNPVKMREILIGTAVGRRFHGDVFASADMLRKKYAAAGLL